MKFHGKQVLWIAFSIPLLISLGLAGYFLLTSKLQDTATDCPQGFEAWIKWRQEALTQANKMQFVSGLNAIQATFQSCKRSFDELGPQKKCFENLDKFSFTSYQTHIKNHSLGLDTSDSDYFAYLKANELGTLPDAFVDSAVLKKIDSTSESEYPNLADYIQSIGPKGTISFYYASKDIPSVDDASVKGRIFVYIPGDKKDIVSQYAVGIGKKGKLPNAISVITVLKVDSQGHQLEKPLVYYNDLWRKRTGNSIAVENRIVENRRMENCYSCHKSPFIPIYPDADTFDFQKIGDRLTAANALMSKYGTAVYVGINSEEYGPPMGLTASSISECQASQSISAETRANLNCADCHNGHDRGSLNFPSGLDSQLPGSTSLVKLFVQKFGLMPPMHQNLKPEEREAILKCLVNDYYGDFNDIHKGRLNKWLLQEDCHS